MSKGYLALVLHCHLPYVRHPEHQRFMEEDWLFEAISETYLPLLRVFERMWRDGVHFRLTLSISPTLAAMLQDELLQSRYIQHVKRLIELSNKEIKRTSSEAKLNKLARMYLGFFEENLESFIEKYNCNLLTGFKFFQKEGALELITTAATHCFLPLMQVAPRGVEAQIRVAIESHVRNFGSVPEGIWLPECGFYPGVEEFLDKEGVKYFFMDSRGILLAREKPLNGVYAPLLCNNGVAAFGRDPETAEIVWSSEAGYPGHYAYREFYRDIGFDLPLEYLKDYLPEGSARVNTGIKYHAVTGKTEDKLLYNREEALRKASEHGAHFVDSLVRQVERLEYLMDREPLFGCPYDAELFGHWWFEGPQWIESVIRKIAVSHDRIEMITPSDYLKRYPDNQKSEPSFSSWGNKGYAEVWLDRSNDWIYPHLHKMTELMADLAGKNREASGLRRRALNQAARELLLSQASDWAFIMKMKTTAPYALRRTREHIYNFNHLHESITKNIINQKWLSSIEQRNSIFPFIDYRIYSS